MLPRCCLCTILDMTYADSDRVVINGDIGGIGVRLLRP